MARIRTVKPDFFTSLTIARLDVFERLSFIGLWTHVDDYGRCVDDARLVKAAVWPLDERTADDVEGDLRTLAAEGLVVRYVVGGRSFLAVVGWAEHQKVSHPAKSKIPPPPEGVEPPPQGRRSEPPEGLANSPEDFASGRLNGANAGPIGASISTVTSENFVDSNPPEDLQSPPEILRSDQGSGIGSGKGKDQHQRAREDTLHLIAKLTGATDDESSSIYDKILTRHKPDNPGGYVRTMHRNGHLVGVLSEVRTERARAIEAAARRDALDARLHADDPPERHATPEEGAAARATLRALAANAKRPKGGEPAAFGAILGQARSA